ncbi:MAG: diaminopimelate decarboxylase [Bacteroidetes bacterium 4572_117]|nr:MAG: diaminopimelate decarboxylase [Bacteroidetes bacterium 4572_117]
MFSKKEIGKFNELETPFFYYNTAGLKNTLKKIKLESEKYGYIVHYAMKANANDKLLSIIKDFGFGADCVSGNEVKKAVDIGFNNKKIAFAGVGKSDKEINIGLGTNIFTFNCESLQEIEVINEMAEKKAMVADIAIRINPNVNAHTHHYITTGLEENKFGVNSWEFEKLFELLSKLKNVRLLGLHFHVGSQITDLKVFKDLCLRVNGIQKIFIDNDFPLEHINVGGGLGVDYEHPDNEDFPDFEAFFALFHNFLELKQGQDLHFELGRSVIARAGDLISRVLYIKKGIKTNFAVLDAGMTELIRPALYQAIHKIENISSNEGIEFYDVVGPICESSDTFAKNVQMKETKRGDLIAIRTAGAYGQVMASNYNLRDFAKAYYSDELLTTD